MKAYSDLTTAIDQIDNLEQYSRKDNLEVHGIPEQTDENIVNHIITLGNALNVTIQANDIDICHRLPNKNSDKPKPIIVKFKSHQTKKKLYEARKHLRNLNLDRFFDDVDINENLTKMRRELFSKVWKRKKQQHWNTAPGR